MLHSFLLFFSWSNWTHALALKSLKFCKIPVLKVANISFHKKSHFMNMVKKNFSVSPVIRQKGESQNGCFKKAKHAKMFEKQTFLTPWYAHALERLNFQVQQKGVKIIPRAFTTDLSFKVIFGGYHFKVASNNYSLWWLASSYQNVLGAKQSGY